MHRNFCRLVLPGLIALMAGCRALPDTPLGRAAASGDVETIRRMLAEGSRAGEPDGHGLTPLAWAARSGQGEAIDALVDAGASADQPDQRHGWRPLLHAIHKGQEEAARRLIARGAAAERLPSDPVAPIIMAAGSGNTAIVRLLLDAGADPRVDDGAALWAASGGGAIEDITDGPPIGTCFPETMALLSERAPDLKLPRGAGTAAIALAARGEACRKLIAGLRQD